MSKPTDSTRRAALGALASLPALAVLPAVAVAAVSPDADAEIFALSIETQRISARAAEVSEKRIEPFEETFQALMHDGPGAFKERAAAAFAYSRETGREDAIAEQEQLHERAALLFARMAAIPATTQAGKAAKVRALFAHGLGPKWRGPASELDYDKQQTRALLGEFAGMSADELAAI